VAEIIDAHIFARSRLKSNGKSIRCTQPKSVDDTPSQSIVHLATDSGD